MDMKNYIEQAEKKAGSQIKLAEMLDITASYIRMVKASKRGLPIEMCIMLADYIGADRLEVIVASNLVTEKDEKKRRILESCFSRAASITVAALFTSILMFSSGGPIHAAPIEKNYNNTNYWQLPKEEI